MGNRLEQLINSVKTQAPAFCEVADDGAKWRCAECDQLDTAEQMFFVATPNGRSGTYHKTCLDADWLTRATRVPGKI